MMNLDNNQTNKFENSSTTKSEQNNAKKEKASSDFWWAFLWYSMFFVIFAVSCLLLYYGVAELRPDCLLGAGTGFAVSAGPIIANHRHNKRK